MTSNARVFLWRTKYEIKEIAVNEIKKKFQKINIHEHKGIGRIKSVLERDLNHLSRLCTAVTYRSETMLHNEIQRFIKELKKTDYKSGSSMTLNNRKRVTF